MTLASVYSNLVSAALEMEIKYLALLYTVLSKVLTTDAAELDIVVVASAISE